HRVAADAGKFDCRNAGQRIHRSRFGHLSLLTDRTRLPAVRRHLHRAGDREVDADATGQTARQLIMATIISNKAMALSDKLYRRRRIRNAIALSLALAATAFGLFWLVWILWTALINGLAAINWALFSQMTPAPGSDGGLLNAFFGSLVMSFLAILIGAPIGIAAGTYLAEYANKRAIGETIRFINDILLSAPSIVLGLFVYTIFVATMGHFSGFAGALALALIVIPVVV